MEVPHLLLICILRLHMIGQSSALLSLLTCHQNIAPPFGNVKNISNTSITECAAIAQRIPIATSFHWKHEGGNCSIYNDTLSNDYDQFVSETGVYCYLMRCKRDQKYSSDVDDYRSCSEDKYKKGVYAEIYLNIGAGYEVKDLKDYPKYQEGFPDQVEIFSQFETPWSNRYDNSGYELTAMFKPPRTGQYSFGANCDNGCEVLLSSNEEENNFQRIIKSKTGNYASSEPLMSKEIPLLRNHHYLLRGTLKESTEGDYIRVGVKFPNGRYLGVIPEKYLHYKESWRRP